MQLVSCRLATVVLPVLAPNPEDASTVANRHRLESWQAWCLALSDLLQIDDATGQWHEGVEHGHGQCITADGAVYDGQWARGSRCFRTDT